MMGLLLRSKTFTHAKFIIRRRGINTIIMGHQLTLYRTRNISMVLTLKGYMKTIKMLILRFLLPVCMFTFTTLKAQQDTTYNTETIYLTFSGFVKNNKQVGMGLSGKELKQELMVSPDALIMFKKYQHKRNWTFVFSGLQLATEIVALTTKNKSLKTGLLIGGGALSAFTIPLYIGSMTNINKAVWLRNRDVLKK